ncbi:MAG: glycogen/starch synthase [Patescibacteria group bacterium]
MKEKTKILFLSSELTPLAKAGGLADVAGALPKELIKLNLDIQVIIPFYQEIRKQNIKKKKIIARLPVPFGKEIHHVNIYKSHTPDSKVPLFLIENYTFLSRGKIYDSGIDRFIFFTQAIAEFLKTRTFVPDIIHVNDWHPAALISLLKTVPAKVPFKTLLTVHNLYHQGKMPKNKSYLWHPPLFPNNPGNTYNILKSAILNTDMINTVSPTYAQEILTPEYGEGLEQKLNLRKKDLYGILNGIDSSYFNPLKDPFLKYNYSIKSLYIKKKNKTFLQKTSGLPADENIPIFGIVSRLVKQKGFDLLLEIIDDLAKLNAQFIFTGTGSSNIENGFKRAQKKYPDKFYFLNKFDLPFGQYIYGGADMFLMPSRFEPCGLGQMIAMEYGAVPIVHATGGLKDTVLEGKTGFVFKNQNSREFLKAIKRAITAYQNKARWQTIIKNGIKTDHTWYHSAREYKKLYEKLLKQ